MESYNFTFKGRSCADFGVRLLRYNVNSPELREYEDEIAGADGAIDFGTNLGKREIVVVIDIDPDDRSFKRRQSAILSWLSPTKGGGQLIFSDVPERYFDAKLTGRLSVEQIGNYGEISLTFKAVDPFAHSVAESDDIILDSPVLLDDEIGLSDAWTFGVNSPTVLSVNNWGYENVRPIIRVTGNFTNLSIGGFTFSGTVAGGSLVVDCGNYVTKLNGVNAGHRSNGRYISLEPDVNEITIGGAALNCEVTFEFRARFL